MLGRVPSAAAVAALPLGVALFAAGNGATCWAILGGVFVGLVMLWAYAPVIPGLRSLVPAHRRIKQLEIFWTQGDLFLNDVKIEEGFQLAGWFVAVADWEAKTRTWISEHISPLEASRFQRPRVVASSVRGSATVEHSDGRNKLSYQLPVLERLISDQKQALR